MSPRERSKGSAPECLPRYGTVEFVAEEMADVATEAGDLLRLAKDGPESRGLERLRALAAHGSRMPGTVLRVKGD